MAPLSDPSPVPAIGPRSTGAGEMVLPVDPDRPLVLRVTEAHNACAWFRGQWPVREFRTELHAIRPSWFADHESADALDLPNEML